MYVLDFYFITQTIVEKAGAPIVLIGSYANYPLTKYLATIYTVIVIDEYYTSKKCPKCFDWLQQTTDIRHYNCSNSQCKRSDDGGGMQVNKDISASFNIALIFVHLLIHGTRPPPFARS